MLSAISNQATSRMPDPCPILLSPFRPLLLGHAPWLYYVFSLCLRDIERFWRRLASVAVSVPTRRSNVWPGRL